MEPGVPKGAFPPSLGGAGLVFAMGPAFEAARESTTIPPWRWGTAVYLGIFRGQAVWGRLFQTPCRNSPCTHERLAQIFFFCLKWDEQGDTDGMGIFPYQHLI